MAAATQEFVQQRLLPLETSLNSIRESMNELRTSVSEEKLAGVSAFSKIEELMERMLT